MKDFDDLKPKCYYTSDDNWCGRKRKSSGKIKEKCITCEFKSRNKWRLLHDEPYKRICKMLNILN